MAGLGDAKLPLTACTGAGRRKFARLATPTPNSRLYNNRIGRPAELTIKPFTRSGIAARVYFHKFTDEEWAKEQMFTRPSRRV